jgi:hypothetical protein
MPNKKAYSRESAIRCLKFAVENSKGHIKLPLMLWGYHGVGKTEIVKQVAKDMGYNLVVLHLATQDIIDLIGRPVTETIDGIEVQKWSVPGWLHDALENTKKTGMPNIFFLDEFNRGPRLVLASMLPFLIEGVLHTHAIGENDAVLAAANPANENYEVNELTDKALLNRLGHIILRPTVGEYIEYLRHIKTDKWTLDVIKKNPEFAKIPEIELSFDVEPSRRSIVNVMSCVGKKDRAWIANNADNIIEAYLGEDFKDKWLEAFQSGSKNITLEMIQNYDENKDEIESVLLTTIDGVNTVRVDILNKAVEVLKQYVDDQKKVTAKDLDYMIKFFNTTIVPTEAAEAFFTTNKVIKDSMLDVENNLRLGKFFDAKKIVESGDVKSW